MVQNDQQKNIGEISGIIAVILFFGLLAYFVISAINQTISHTIKGIYVTQEYSDDKDVLYMKFKNADDPQAELLTLSVFTKVNADSKSQLLSDIGHIDPACVYLVEYWRTEDIMHNKYRELISLQKIPFQKNLNAPSQNPQ